MYDLSSYESNFRKSFKAFEKLPGQNFSFDASVAVPPQGIARNMMVDHGLYVRIWDCWFDQMIRISRVPAKDSEPVFFTLVYYFTPESVVLANKNEPGIQFSALWNTIFFTSNAECSIVILPGRPVKCFSISFTKDWIQGHSPFHGKMQREFIVKMITASQPLLFFESYTAFEEKMIRDMYINATNIQLCPLFIKARVFAIINHFISKVSERQSLLVPVHVPLHEDRIHQVEARLIQCLDSELPPVKNLAREFALSVSTLKRGFKLLYGKNIKEYYLYKKMIYARQLIGEKNKTVTDTAYLLGYENVSHFIMIFKKYIGCLPGTIRKQAVQCKSTV